MSLRLDGCCVTYLDDGARVSALEDLSLDVPDGRVVLLTGPSGCGKSTVLRCVNGLVPAFHEARLTGGVEVDGRPVAEMTLSGLAAAVGTVFQDPRSEFFTFDVTSELAFPCENLGWEGGSIRRRLGEVAERVRQGVGGDLGLGGDWADGRENRALGAGVGVHGFSGCSSLKRLNSSFSRPLGQ